jgi:hypothetical protein
MAGNRNGTQMKILIPGAGTIVKKGRGHGITTPCNMVELIKFRESLAAPEQP